MSNDQRQISSGVEKYTPSRTSLPRKRIVTPNRPPLSTFSTNSSASSRSSVTTSDDVFDHERAMSELPESPITPPQSLFDPLGKASTTSPGNRGSQMLSELTLEGKMRKRRTSARTIAVDELGTPSPSSRRSSQTQKSTSRTASASSGSSFPDPGGKVAKNRATSAPNLEAIAHEIRYGRKKEKVESSRGESSKAALEQEIGAYQPPAFQLYDEKKRKSSQRKVNRDIYDCIVGKQKKKGALPSNPQVGYIYVFESPTHAPKHVKIGLTKRGAEKREQEVEKCVPQLREVEGFNHKDDFRHHAIVESLVQYSLVSARKKYNCPVCFRQHNEWFEIEKEVALYTINLWRSWVMKRRPYNDKGHLTEYWKWRANKLPVMLSEVKWDSWTQPGLWDYCDFQLEKFSEGYYLRLKAHLERKDSWFLLVGIIITLIFNNLYGKIGTFWSVVALFLL